MKITQVVAETAIGKLKKVLTTSTEEVVKSVENAVEHSGTTVTNPIENAAERMVGLDALANQNRASLNIKRKTVQKIAIRPKTVNTDILPVFETADELIENFRRKGLNCLSSQFNLETGSVGYDPRKFKAYCEAFKKLYGVKLHIPNGAQLDFENNAMSQFIQQLERTIQQGFMPPELKHIFLGHGVGSSIRGDWYTGSVNIPQYISKNIRHGEKVIVCSCETGAPASRFAGEYAIGGEVGNKSVSMPVWNNPAKIVTSGEKSEITGSFHYNTRNGFTDGQPVIRDYISERIRSENQLKLKFNKK